MEEYINKEIDEHLVSVANLRAQKNSFRAALRLPPEILGNIFTRGARDYYEGNTSFSTSRGVPNWVNVSYVCRHWRDVALNCSTLWSYHFTASHRWTEEILARSKQASLKIFISHGPKNVDCWRVNSWWLCLVEKLLNHIERIQELRLNIPAAAIPPQLSLHAPRLQILDIRSPDGFSYPFTIKDGDIPALHTLRLSDCSLPRQLLNLGGVTTLFLRSAVTASRQYIGDFMAMLNRMPALTSLHLEHVLLSARGFLSSGAVRRPRVNLPYLGRLFIAAPASTIVALLYRTNIPLQTHVWLEFESEGSFSNHDYALIPSLVAQRFSQSENPSSCSPTIRSLTVDFSVNGSPTFSASEHVDCDSELSRVHRSQVCSVPLTALIGMKHSFEISNHFWSDICCSIPSTYIQTLHVNKPPSSHDFWRITLGHLNGLRHIKLSEGDMPDLVSLLTLAIDEPVEVPMEHTIDHHDPTPGHIFVPVLEKLELYRIQFQSNELSEGTISKQSLRDALSTRTVLHPRLIMTECKVKGEVELSEDETDSDWFDPFPF